MTFSTKRFSTALLASALLPATTWAQGVPVEHYIVVLHPGSGAPAEVAQGTANRTGGRVGYVYNEALQGFSISIPPSAVAALESNPRVAFVEKDRPVSLFQETSQEIPTGIKRSFTNEAALDIDGTNDFVVDVDVAVIDTGIDYEHPDLNVVGGTNCNQSEGGGPPWARSYFCDDSLGGDDDHFHGTHVGGTIGAYDNGIGVVGIAPGARLWAVKALDSQGSGELSGIIAGIDWVVAHGGIEVINMSLGGAGTSAAMNTAVQNAVDAGVTVVVAAGNSDVDAAGHTPANAPAAVTVSALADFDGTPGGFGAPTCRVDQDDTLADFSNWGSTVDIAAPGVCILSTYPLEQGSYASISGTSMASPHVAGAAALLASNGSTPAQIRSTLLNTANFNWVDDSGDGLLEPLLDIRNAAYTPALIVSDGAVGTGNEAPLAAFTASCTGLECSFADESTDSDGNVVSWEWSFGDGASSTEQSPVHTYSGDGSYGVALTVTDDGGLSAETAATVTVSSDSTTGTPDSCDGLADMVFLTGSSASQGSTWIATVDALKCEAGDVANFTIQPQWISNGGSASGDCSTATGECTSTLSGMRKNVGSVTFEADGASIVINKP